MVLFHQTWKECRKSTKKEPSIASSFQRICANKCANTIRKHYTRFITKPEEQQTPKRSRGYQRICERGDKRGSSSTFEADKNREVYTLVLHFSGQLRKNLKYQTVSFNKFLGHTPTRNFQFLAVHTSHTHVHFAKIPIAQGLVLLCMCSFPKCTNTPLLYISKGQLISIRLFCFFNSSKKTNKKFLHQLTRAKINTSN